MQQPGHGIGLDRVGARERVVFRRGVSGGKRLGHAAVYLVAQLAVDTDKAAEPRRLVQKLAQRVVTKPQVVVGHIRLEARHALCRHIRHLAARRLVPVGHGHVEAVVCGAASVGAAVPERECVRERTAALLRGEVEDGCRAAAERRRRAAREVVRRHRAGTRHIEVGVAVDEAGEKQLAAHIHDLVRRARCDDFSALHEDIPCFYPLRAYHAPAAQYDHADRLRFVFFHPSTFHAGRQRNMREKMFEIFGGLC